MPDMTSKEEPLLSSSSKRPFPSPEERRVIGVLLGVSFTSNVIVSLVAPILPWHLKELGESQIWCGIMFGAPPFATLICTPLAKAAISHYGRVPLLFAGLLLQGFSSVTFGFADDLTGGEGEHVHLALAVLLLSRMVCGCGAALANVAIFAVVVERFGSKEGEAGRLGEVNGWNEVIIGVGFTIGPPLGNALFLSGGFKFPFVVSSLMLLAFAPCAFLLQQSPLADGEVSEEVPHLGLLQVLKPGLLVPAGSLLLGTAVFGIVEPVLTLYLEDGVGVSARGVGAMFAVFAASYSGSSPLTGRSADRIGASTVCALGTFLAGLIMAVILGPMASMLFERGSTARIAYEAVGLGLLGVAQSCTLIPTLSAMGQGLGALADRPGTDDCVSAWFVMFLNFGLAVGPLLGTMLVDSFGFEQAVGLCGVGIASYGALALVLDTRWQRSRKRTPAVRRLSTPTHMITIGLPSDVMERQVSSTSCSRGRVGSL